MTKAKRFLIIYHSHIKDYLRSIDRKSHSLIHQTIDTQVSYEPENEIRNRKPVIQPFPFAATWEIRFGPQNCFRVFYEVERAELVVTVLAIGEKRAVGSISAVKRLPYEDC